jgi:hypothetical protein
MSQIALHTLVGTALTDHNFCHDLLNGRRRTLLAQFDLTNEEREAILGIQADTLQEFASQLCEWLKAQKSPTFYPNTAMPVSCQPFRSIRAACWQ